MSEKGAVENYFGDTQFKIFSIMWAIATLFHLAHSSLFDKHLQYALLTLAALYAIFQPSVLALIMLSTLQILDVLISMPLVTNHWIFTAFVNLTILQALVYVVVKQKSFNVSGSHWLNTFAPIVRIELIILYFFAVFHKLNSAFFLPSSSCASYLLLAQNINSFIPLTDELLTFNSYFTIFVETAIPLMIIFKRTRDVGILVGIFFHCVLAFSSYNAFYDFSSMILATYFLFMPPTFTSSTLNLYNNIKATISSAIDSFNFKKLGGLVVLFLGSLTILYILNAKLRTFEDFHLYFFWTIYIILFCFCFVYYLYNYYKLRLGSISFQLIHWSFFLVPAFVFLNGMSPYLGLKTENSYSMFSNLRTEGGVTNHYIIPVSLQIFNFQKDVVEIVSSSDARLNEMAKKKQLMVLFEFKNYIHDRKPQWVEYLLNNKRERFNLNELTNQTMLQKNPTILKKVMKFRSFSKYEPQPCGH